MKEKFLSTVLNYKFIIIIYVILALLISLQSYFGGVATFEGRPYTHFNNFIIFKQSFFHLIHNQDLYILYPSEHWDYYKYSPTFALFMTPLAMLPDIAGLFIWNLINALPLLIAIKLLPATNDTNKKYILWFILLELITSMQNEQSNGLIAGLIILGFVLLEKEKPFWAILLILFSAYIKIFGILAIVLLLFYPNKIRNTVYTVFWGLILLTLPLVVVSPHQLVSLYLSWKNLLSMDASQSVGLSVAGWLQTWFGLDLPKSFILIPGIVLFALPLLKRNLYNNLYYKILFLASVLIWMVIFNHKAESPTFIIAICGVALWYFPQARKTENTVLLIIALIFTMLSPTDLFPPFIRNSVFKPYVIKVVPCIIIWFKILYDSFSIKPGTSK